MLIVHLFISYAHLISVTFSLPPGVRGCLRLPLVALLDVSVYLKKVLAFAFFIALKLFYGKMNKRTSFNM